MAAFLPHYAVHYADAEHSLKEVTKGYRVVLVYSICLPLQMRHLELDSDKPLITELTHAIDTMGPEDESFALLLSHEYTEKSIRDLGSDALKGIDRARFCVLQEANAAVSADKKLVFYLALVKHNITYFGDDGYEMGGWSATERENKIVWFLSRGECFGLEECKMKMNFLNPGYETYYDLWRNHGTSKEEGFTGNFGPTKETVYSRYAIIAWPAINDIKSTTKWINPVAAVRAIQRQKPVDAEAFKDCMNALAPKLAETNDEPNPGSAVFWEALCELLIEVGDFALVKVFFSKLFEKCYTQLSDGSRMAPLVASILRSFDWDYVAPVLIEALEQLDEANSMEMALKLAGEVNDGVARNTLMTLAVQKATQFSGNELCSFKYNELLWTWALRPDDKGMFDVLVNKINQADASALSPAIETFTKYLGGVDASGDKFSALASIVSKRMAWLNENIQSLDKPFAWSMPDAQFPDNAHVEEFLRGTGTSMTTKGICNFSSLQEARNYAAHWMQDVRVQKASFEIDSSEENGTVFVTITKTKGWFYGRQKTLKQYKSELEMLARKYEVGSEKRRTKQARLE